MTIFIEKALKARPDAVALPAEVDLCATLRSDRDGEPVTITYALGADHDVRFETAGGATAKTVTFEATLRRDAEARCDAVRLVRGPGEPAANVRIEQTLAGADNEESSVCRLTVLAAGDPPRLDPRR